LPEALRAAAIPPEAQWIIYGMLMVLIVFFLPAGIVPAMQQWWQRRQGNTAAPAKAAL
jgi:branched-chain amino acid transport system permease protein